MTKSKFTDYRWCDSKGSWYSGYPSDTEDCIKLLGFDEDGEWTDCTPDAKLDGTVAGTAGADVIDTHYTGDPDGDKIDNNDAILPGAGSQDDLVYGYGGNDNIQTFDGNDVVYGGDGDDVIDDASGTNQGAGDDTFFGDAGHDKIWGGIGDDKLYGGTGNDYVNGEEGNDLVDGGSGKDIVVGGSGDDTLIGGTGDDLAYGGAGNDVIHGDTAGQGGDTEPAPTTYVRESFEWDKAPDPSGNGTSIDNDDNLSRGFTQDTGNVTVSFSQTGAVYTPDTHFATDQQKVHSITADGQPVNANSSLESLLNSDRESATYDLTFSAAVGNVSFRINDIDNASKVTIRAYDAQGNLIAIDTSNGSGLNAQNLDGVGGNEFITSNGGNGADTDPTYSSLVNIAGPVARIEVVHAMQQSLSPGNYAEINITDVYFDAPVDNGTVPAVDGNDQLFGGAGEDIIAGEGGNDVVDGGSGNDALFGGDGNDTLRGGTGNDSIDGGAGNDVVYGGDDRDTIMGGAGDTVDGGAGGNDYDILDVTGQGAYVVTGPDGTGSPIPDSNGNGIDGRLVFVDEDGVPTGGEINFTEIEQIIGTPYNTDPDAVNDRFDARYDEAAGDVDGNVLLNDTDADGNPLTVVGVGGTTANGNVGTPVLGDNGGLFTINADGSVDFDANGDFDGLGLNDTRDTSVTYTLSDGKGGFDTATATFTVGGVNDGTVFGTDGNDVMNPGYVDANGDIIDGNDAILQGDRGDDDLIYGQGGNDTINAGSGNDEVYGGTGNDSVTGGAGNDTVFGDAGNDILRGGAGNDAVYGGEGDDTGFGGDGEDTVFGDAGNDTLNGNAGKDVVYGGEGDDSLHGENGDDTLHGDAGADTIAGGKGSDTAFGGDGDDVIDTSNKVDPYFDNPYPGIPGAAGVTDPDPFNDRDVVYGGAGNDMIITGDDQDTVFGGTGNDTIDSGIDNDSIDGGDGDDTVIAGEGADVIEGGAGNDLIYGGLETDLLDVVDYDTDGNPVDAMPGNNKDTIYGGAGNDVIYGRDDADLIFGGDGDDLLYGGIDDDTISGNKGNDTIYGDEGNDTLTGSLDDDTVYGGTGDDFIQGGGGADVLFGDEGNDRIQGGPDDDSIYGGDGDDSIQGGGGADFIDGGAGNDLIGGADGADSILGGDGDDIIRAAAGDDSIMGGAGNDVIYAGDGADTVAGNLGDDTIYGGAGDDSLTGSFGNDSVYGGAGDDFIQGGADTDLLDGGDGDDRIQGDGGSDLIYGGAGNDSIQSGAGDDTVFGGTGDDLVSTGEGDDLVYGGTGDDTIRSEGGSDEVYGGDGNDVIFTDQGNDNIPDRDYPGDGLAADADPFNNRDTVYGGAGNDTIKTGDDADLIFGGDGDDTIDGGIDNDTITGGAGADVIKGGLGSDLIIGGTAGDRVIGGEDPDNSDIDVLDLTGSNVDKIVYDLFPDGTRNPEAGTVHFSDGSTMTFSEIENVIPCFTPGTTIATPKGERLIEDLRVGDRVITRDNGIQEIAWVGHKELSGTQLASSPHLKPILIKAGALGAGLPERDMLLSPNHRVLVASEKTQLYFEEREVLAAAKHMIGAQGIHAVDVMRTTYIHFMFERHEVVLSNGAWTESFQPGDYSLKGIGNSQRNEIFELFPELATKTGLEGYQSARKALKKHEARLLMK